MRKVKTANIDKIKIIFLSTYINTLYHYSPCITMDATPTQNFQMLAPSSARHCRTISYRSQNHLNFGLEVQQNLSYGLLPLLCDWPSAGYVSERYP